MNRPLMQSKGLRIACLVILVLFFAICGLHVAGGHQEADPAGVGLTDLGNLAMFLLTIFLAVVVLAGSLGAAAAHAPGSTASPLASRSFRRNPQLSSRSGSPLRC